MCHLSKVPRPWWDSNINQPRVGIDGWAVARTVHAGRVKYTALLKKSTTIRSTSTTVVQNRKLAASARATSDVYALQLYSYRANPSL